MSDSKGWHSSVGQHKILSGYEMKKTLGRGHFAVVKLAHHVFTGEKVAIKVIDKTKLDKISKEHLFQEVTCMKLVQHPNVVRLYEVIDTETKLYLILELGDGGDMYDYIMKHDQGLSEDQARNYFAQIVHAISYCHQLHIVHRDLKPENVVFFESQGIVKLTDFGFSNLYRPGEKLSTSCGSLAYSAPEILLGEEYDAPAVDVWSLGVILYMLVCGEAPFNEANDSETLTNIMDCRYNILDHVSEECCDLIEKMIIKNPSDRISLKEIENHPWLIEARILPENQTNYYSPILSRDSISNDLHEKITNTMVQGNIAILAEIEEAIHADRYDHITSTYFLIAEKILRRKCMESIAMEVEESDPKIKNNNTKQIKSKTHNVLIPQIPEEQIQTSSTASSPPCQQAYLTATYHPHKTFNSVASVTTEESLGLENIAEDSESASSSSSSLPSKVLTSPAHQHLHHREKKASPSYPREHLTITPRHGFSVAKGGIVTLIEEEERSRSQTTTDDEDDTVITEDERRKHNLNPHQLASSLQRATIQIKRIKKRKSAPVLNEICEENEGENESGNTNPVSDPALAYRHESNNGRYRHPHPECYTRHRSTSDVEFFAKSTMEDTVPELTLRQGRSISRRKTHKSSGSETSDDDSESRRASRTNLSGSVFNSLNRIRRDSSGDRDQGGGNSGGFGSKKSEYTLNNSNKETNEGHDSTDNQHCNDNSGVNDQVDAEASLQENKNTSNLKTPHNNNNSSCSCVNSTQSKVQVLNNTRYRGRIGSKHKAPYSQITNVFEKRSKSAESSTSYKNGGSQTSSARSSCSNLSIGKRKGRLLSTTVRKNSSSTMSDTGLVLRWNNLRRAGAEAGIIPRSPSSSSFSSVFPPGSMWMPISEVPVNTLHRPHSEGNVMEERNINLFSVSNKDKHATTVLRSCNHVVCQINNNPMISVQPSIPETNRLSFKQNLNSFSSSTSCDGRESNIKRSNISLASSTCSASKFAVDPINELLPSPVPENDEHLSNGKTNYNSPSFSDIYNNGDKKDDKIKLIKHQKCSSPSKGSRYKMSIFSYLSADNIFRKKSNQTINQIGAGDYSSHWDFENTEKLKTLPGTQLDLHDITRHHKIPHHKTAENDLVIHKLKADCCTIM